MAQKELEITTNTYIFAGIGAVILGGLASCLLGGIPNTSRPASSALWLAAASASSSERQIKP